MPFFSFLDITVILTMIFAASNRKVQHFSIAMRESDYVTEEIVAFCKNLRTRRNMKVLVLVESGDLIPDVVADIWNGVTTRAVGFHQAIFSESENTMYVERFSRNHVSNVLHY